VTGRVSPGIRGGTALTWSMSRARARATPQHRAASKIRPFRKPFPGKPTVLHTRSLKVFICENVSQAVPVWCVLGGIPAKTSVKPRPGHVSGMIKHPESI
jgi:hypothetical protein